MSLTTLDHLNLKLCEYLVGILQVLRSQFRKFRILEIVNFHINPPGPVLVTTHEKATKSWGGGGGGGGLHLAAEELEIKIVTFPSFYSPIINFTRAGIQQKVQVGM